MARRRDGEDTTTLVWVPPLRSWPPPAANKRELSSAVEKFLEGIPTTEEQWSGKRKSVGLSSAADILNAVDLSMYLFCDNSPAIPNQNNNPDLQEVLLSLARRFNSRGLIDPSDRFTHNMSHFLSLVSTAICRVAKNKRYPLKSVDAALKGYLEERKGICHAGPKQLREYRAAVGWLLQEQQRQFRRGLGHRAFELFFNGTEIAPGILSGL
jgi:hypothetical protein